MVILTGESRNTLKKYFGKLAENRQLSMLGRGRGVWYRLDMTGVTLPDIDGHSIFTICGQGK